MRKKKIKKKNRKGLWNSIETRRKFFIDYAKEKGFDPLIPENWYTVQAADIAAINIVIPPHPRTPHKLLLLTQRLLAQFGGFKRVLEQTFPELKWEFPGSWHNHMNWRTYWHLFLQSAKRPTIGMTLTIVKSSSLSWLKSLGSTHTTLTIGAR